MNFKGKNPPYTLSFNYQTYSHLRINTMYNEKNKKESLSPDCL